MRAIKSFKGCAVRLFPLGFAFLIAVAAHYMARTNALSWVRTLCMQLMLDNI